ncbi:MAG TPA: hypothetical protein ENK14_14020 [Caldithrix sp.]|nr:hypothetical protein [Caldithrix sp.]
MKNKQKLKPGVKLHLMSAFSSEIEFFTDLRTGLSNAGWGTPIFEVCLLFSPEVLAIESWWIPAFAGMTGYTGFPGDRLHTFQIVNPCSEIKVFPDLRTRNADL